MLVEELHGRRLSDQRDDTQRVRLDGKILNVRVGSELVSVTMAFGQGDPDVLSKVAAHLDAAVGSGKYDALFRAPAHFHAR
jgi:ubiquinone biosynthesis protein UbiJ